MDGSPYTPADVAPGLLEIICQQAPSGPTNPPGPVTRKFFACRPEFAPATLVEKRKEFEGAGLNVLFAAFFAYGRKQDGQMGVEAEDLSSLVSRWEYAEAVQKQSNVEAVKALAAERAKEYALEIERAKKEKEAMVAP